MRDLTPQLTQLLSNRFHGAVNIKGIRFQILYSVLRSFELYSETITTIQLEGIEDIDTEQSFRFCEEGDGKSKHKYIQVKTSGTSMHWGTFKSKKILDNFLAVWKLDRAAEFLVVSNFAYHDRLDELVKFCHGQKTKLSKQLEQDLIAIFRSMGLQRTDIPEFLSKLKFERTTEEEVTAQIRSNVVRHFALESDNSELYMLALISNFLDWAEKREAIKRQDLERTRHFVQDQINLGTTNPAIQNGWLELLKFETDTRAEDYYEGTNARPGHIVAGFDVERTEWLEEIATALREIGTCIIRTASGQGKSSLLYRYAYANYQPETTFIVKHLSDEPMVGAAKHAILAKKTLGLPILVLIDNVRSDLRYWTRLITELAGHNVHIIATIREEDWFRYSDGEVGFRSKIVSPTLSLDEARSIFNEFRKQGKVAAEIESAEHAFEQVADRRLLLEFTYLITHGQMLSKRLLNQVQDMLQLGEDKAKLHVLRLVSVAQIYESKIETRRLVENVQFVGDPDSTLVSLRKEYLMVTEDGCEGLHLVRSQHLVQILHQVVSVEDTIKELVKILDSDNLISFVASVFSDPDVNHNAVLKDLVERCQNEPLGVISKIVEALFTANERNYFRLNKSLFDEAKASYGFFFLSANVMPFPYDAISTFGEILADNPSFTAGFEQLSSIASRFPGREWESRTDVAFMREMTPYLSKQKLLEEFEDAGPLLDWYRLPGVDVSVVKQMLDDEDWGQAFDQVPRPSIPGFLFNLSWFSRARYDIIVDERKASFVDQYRELTDTLSANEEDGEISIEFFVDEADEAVKPHEQAFDRLTVLHEMFPFYERYNSQGIYPADFGVDRVVDDTEKHIARDQFELRREASKNAIFDRIVKANYAVTSIYEWQKDWYEYRRDASKMIFDFIDLGQTLSLGKEPDFDGVNRQLNDLRERSTDRPQLAESLGKKMREAQQAIDFWAGSLQTFFTQVASTDADSRRLCRFNLRDSASRLFKAQEAFKLVTESTHSYFDFVSLEKNERENYFLLAEVLDVLYDPESKGLPRNLKSFITGQKRDQIKKINNSLADAFAELAAEGFSFVYPVRLLTKSVEIGGLETSICLGFETLDFTAVLHQLEIILLRIPNFGMSYWNFYLVPLIDGRTYGENCWYISQSNIERLQNNEDVGAWALLPQPLTSEVLSTLPPLEKTEIPEIPLVATMQAACMEMHVLRRTRTVLREKLAAGTDADAHMIAVYGEKMSQRMQTIEEAVARALADLENFSENLYNEAGMSPELLALWSGVVGMCVDRLREGTEVFDVDLTEGENVSFWSNRDIDLELGQYLNLRYRNSISNEWLF